MWSASVNNIFTSYEESVFSCWFYYLINVPKILGEMITESQEVKELWSMYLFSSDIEENAF